mmetsp:Transcript_19481/g.24530  ORF Transcript_19481/g.24530 Transcript_19481/m.24530 type:complete len:326 (+) Transcript_19481:28-1005(+)
MLNLLKYLIIMSSNETKGFAWRFGYGSNIGLETLQQKKNLHPKEYKTGTIQGWELYFTKGFKYVEPGWAAVRPFPSKVLHGSAFLIPNEEVEGLDKQEAGYNVLPCRFVSYEGGVIENVGLYVPKSMTATEGTEPKVIEEGVPSLRYLRLLQNGAKSGKLSPEWIQRLDSLEYYITPPKVRAQTNAWIADFHADPERKDILWTAEELAKYNGSRGTSSNNADSGEAILAPHVSSMEYIVELHPKQWVFSSWKGHNITRRNLLQFNGKSLDTNDIRYDQEGFRPLPKLSECSDEEREYLMQNLDSLLHQGGKIVARLKPFLDDQGI